MEEVAEGIGRGFLRVIKWIIIDAFIELFIHGYGYLTLKIITIGKYPKPDQDNDTLCVVAGLISFAVTIGIIMFINSN
jgi:hypothetical protein